MSDGGLDEGVVVTLDSESLSALENREEFVTNLKELCEEYPEAKFQKRHVLDLSDDGGSGSRDTYGFISGTQVLEIIVTGASAAAIKILLEELIAKIKKKGKEQGANIEVTINGDVEDVNMYK